MFAFGDDQLIFFHEIFHDFQAGRVQLVHLPELFLLFVEAIHEALVSSDEAESFAEQVSFSKGGRVFLKGVAVLGRVDEVLDVGLVLGDLVFEVFEVHLDFLFQFDVAADGGFQFLRLCLQRGVAVDADEVLRDDVDEVLDEVVGEQRLGGGDLRVLVEAGEVGEVVLCGEHGLEGVEDGVLRLLADFLGGVPGRGEQGLELFDHYKWWVASMRKHTQQAIRSLQVHLPLAAAATGRVPAAPPATPLQLLLAEAVEVPHRAKLPHCALRVLVGLDLRDLAHAFANSPEFLELADLFGVDVLEQVDGLVDHEVDDGDVGEEPGVESALLLVEGEDGLDLVLPVVFHALLVLDLAGRPSRTGRAQHCKAEVGLAAQTVHQGLLLQRTPEELRPVGLLDDVGDDGHGSHRNEVALLQEGEVADYPLLRFSLPELGPLVGVEEAVAVGQAQVLAEQSADLSLGAEGVVGERHLAVAFQVHYSNAPQGVQLMFIF